MRLRSGRSEPGGAGRGRIAHAIASRSIGAIFAAINDPRVDPRIRLAIELAAECRAGQVLRFTRQLLVLPDGVPNDYETAPTGSLGQVEIPGAGKKHGEIVVLTPEQRRATEDALSGYLANYEAAWKAGQIEDYYLFPGSKTWPKQQRPTTASKIASAGGWTLSPC